MSRTPADSPESRRRILQVRRRTPRLDVPMAILGDRVSPLAPILKDPTARSGKPPPR
ncbi:hypothetical protein D3C87_977380 [compost metagenome]